MGTVESGDGVKKETFKSLGGYSPEPYKRYVYADYENNPAHIEQLYRSRQHEAREAKKWSVRALEAEEQNVKLTERVSNIKYYSPSIFYVSIASWILALIGPNILTNSSPLQWVGGVMVVVAALLQIVVYRMSKPGTE